MSTLIDTSVWVNHFRTRNETLVNLILCDQALIHPLIIAEIACGTPPAPRLQTLHDLKQLTPATQATIQEVMDLIEREQLYGLGCGFVDCCLLASTLITTGATLWTSDKKLNDLAKRFGVSYSQQKKH